MQCAGTKQTYRERFIEDGKFNYPALKELLVHASQTVPFYKNYVGCSDLIDFPVVNKSVLRENLKSHLSTSYKKGDLTHTTTRGSTGTPFTIYFDKRKRLRHTAALMYWNEKAGAPLGQRMYYLRVWNKMNRKGRLTQLIENIIPVEVSHFDDNECSDLFTRIKSHRGPVSILGFSSAITELARRGNGKIKNLKSIIAMSEHLSESVRQSARVQFGCPIVARYSNMENGFIAQQYDERGGYLINNADFIVEILKMDADKPAAEGEKGRIVVTDLFNYAMPFIRYDTGDIGSMIREDNGSLVLNTIDGRKADVIFDTSGNILSSHVITNSLWMFTEIVQFQFVQTGESCYKIRINMGGKPFNRERELTLMLLKYLGENATLITEYVDEVPVLNSGKRRYIINEYLANKK